MDFSVVVPVKDEVHLIPRTLRSYYAVSPSEVIICTDNPAPKEVLTLVRKIARNHCAEQVTRIIEVEEDPEWKYHQAHVRRAGFHEAKYDRILTGDVDLLINRNVLKALRLVGRNNIGLASCAKFFRPNSFSDFYRLMGTGIIDWYIRKLAELYRGRHMPRVVFTGLYAMWRPFWLDSENEEDVKKLASVKQKLQHSSLQEIRAMTDLYGEDVYLCNCMRRKHEVVCLSDIGAIVLRNPVEKHPHMQWLRGFYSAVGGRTWPGTLAKTFVRAEPYYLKGYLDGTKMKRSE